MYALPLVVWYESNKQHTLGMERECVPHGLKKIENAKAFFHVQNNLQNDAKIGNQNICQFR